MGWARAADGTDCCHLRLVEEVYRECRLCTIRWKVPLCAARCDGVVMKASKFAAARRDDVDCILDDRVRLPDYLVNGRRVVKFEVRFTIEKVRASSSKLKSTSNTRGRSMSTYRKRCCANWLLNLFIRILYSTLELNCIYISTGERRTFKLSTPPDERDRHLHTSFDSVLCSLPLLFQHCLKASI